MKSLIRELLDQRNIEYLILDKHLCIQQTSLNAARLSEKPEAARIGEDIRNSFPELNGAESALNSVLREELSEWRLRGVARTRDTGSPLFVDINIALYRPQGELNAGLVVFVQDVTERMSLERTLVQSSREAKLLLSALMAAKAYNERIIDSMADALFVTSPDGIIETANRTALQLFGYHKGELVGQHINRIIKDEQLIPSHATRDQSPPFDCLRNVELPCIGKNGEEFPVAVSCSVVQTEDDELEGFIYLVRDIREDKRAKAEITKLRTEVHYLQEEINSEMNFEEIVGNSPAIKKVFRQVEKVAKTDSTVLLSGETGTGKELIARAIHNRSRRNEEILLKVNCAALPSGLVESELFGHEKGAFTGAVSLKRGKFELADRGTIFLDEVGELPLDTQAKLLRVLQEKEFERVGGTETLKADVRVIAASNKNLSEAVKLGAFRNDLFYRLNVFPIRVPALRDRKGDIPLLVSYFVRRFAWKMTKRIEGVSKKAMGTLMGYDWPGNVRELASILERAVILTEGGVLENVDLPIKASSVTLSSRLKTLEEVQRDHILNVLEITGGTIEGPNGAAKRLHLNPSTLRSRMRKLGIVRKGSTYKFSRT